MIVISPLPPTLRHPAWISGATASAVDASTEPKEWPM
jgi:hypothetical protein